MSSYVELHCHSAFSLLDGASSPEALVTRALSLGHRALALTDHDDLGGIVAFAQAADEAGIDGIVGAEVTVVTGSGKREAGSGKREWGIGIRDSIVRDNPHVFAGPIPSARKRAPARFPIPASRHHILLLAQDREGYGNLSSLITRARMDNPRGNPGVSLDVLADYSQGLFALTGCPRGWVPSLAASGDLDGACEAAATLIDIYGGRVAIECWDHGLDEERRVVPGLTDIARSLGVPWVVTNDVHYAEPRGRVVHDVLCCLRHQKMLDSMGTRLRPNGEWYLKSGAQMARRWQHAPEGIRATIEIAERCAFRMHELRPTLPAFPLPPGVTADEYLARLVETGAAERLGVGSGELGVEGKRGIGQEMEVGNFSTPHSLLPTPYSLQLSHELEIIRKLRLAGYFLIVWDIVRFARREGILCQGRGSAANSAVCFCLGITAIDPVKMGLLFERFLSEERQGAPDIDIDFAHRDREKVLQYVYARYGREHAAMVCEQITYRGKSAVRDSARVLGFSVEQANTLAMLSDRFSAKATAEAMGEDATPTHHDTGRRGELEQARKAKPLTTADRPKPNAAYEPYGSPSARDSGARRTISPHSTQNSEVPDSRSVHPSFLDPYANDEHVERRNPTTALRSTSDTHTLLSRAGLDVNDRRVRMLPAIVRGLHQIPRHRSIHVGGFVLTREPLSTVVPIEPASMDERTVIQWDKDDVEAAGLVKIDLLGLGMLTLIQDCLKYIRATRGHTIDLAQLDMTDQAVYDDLCRADTIGVFQVESRAQMNTLPRLKPRCFYDLVVEVAIIRPGPIQGDMVHPYLRRRAGEETVTYPHPSLEPILKRTLGVPLFQDQGMQVAIACAGFSAGEADILRRAMGHKRSRERMSAICEKLIEGMRKNGIDDETARKIYNQINAFADYGFPESHAASFALLVYASAYLKHYYAPEFTSAILNAQPMGFYAPGTLIEDARRHGVKVRPVDLTRSAWDCTLEMGTRTIGNHYSPPVVRLGLRLVRGLGAKAREKLEHALKDGPFRSIGDVVTRSGLDRRSLRFLAEAGAFDSMVPDEPDARRRRAAIWRMLEEFRGDAGPLAPAPVRLEVPPPIPAMSPLEITAADYRMTGVSLNGHPMKHLRDILAPNGIKSAREVLAMRDGERNVATAGLVICRQRPGTAKGFVFLTLEDETGLVNVVVTPKRFERQALMLSTARLLLVRGTLQVEQSVVNLRGEVFRELKAGAGEDGARGHDFH